MWIELSATAALSDHPCLQELLQVEGQRGRGNAHGGCDRSSGHSLRAALHEQAENPQAGLLRQSAERGHGGGGFEGKGATTFRR